MVSACWACFQHVQAGSRGGAGLHLRPPQELDTELERLLQEHAQERSAGVYRIPNQKTAELYQLLRKEAEQGFWVELTVAEAESTLGGFLSWLFFGMVEPDKLRGCLAPQGANGHSVVHLPNQVYMCGLDGYVTLCQHVANCFRKAGRHPPLRGFAEDYAHGFRQFPLSSQDRRFLCATAKAPDSSVRIFVPQRLLFGPRGAPHVFCRVTGMISAVASVLLLVPNVPHVDDMVGLEEEEAVDSARDSFIQLHQALNFRLKESKARPARDCKGGAAQLIALISLQDREAGLVCKIDMPEVKASKYQRMIVEVLEQGSLSPTLAGKLVV